ncbi:MAG: glycosyltransferase [Lachnospiraceae bacterium]|nr:glycosyltransferase [Lachnospiraceae bacterium]
MQKISVIIPVYNTVRFLEKCITSVMRQTFANLEIIIVNDGSTDGSGELARRLKESDSRIKVYDQENKGASSARNYGISVATGEYISFIDSDDYIAPQMYDELIDFIIREKLEVAQISRVEIDLMGQRLPDVCFPPRQETVVDNAEFFRELFLHRGDASFCTKLIKSSLLVNERFPEGVLNEDFHLLIRLLQKVTRIGILPGRYYHVVYHSDSTTRIKSEDSFSRVYHDIIDNADMIETLVSDKYLELSEEAKRFALYQRLEYLLHVPIAQMNRGNVFYRNVIRYLRRNMLRMVKNHYLSRKNKVYLILFAVAPKIGRIVHRRIRSFMIAMISISIIAGIATRMSYEYPDITIPRDEYEVIVPRPFWEDEELIIEEIKRADFIAKVTFTGERYDVYFGSKSIVSVDKVYLGDNKLVGELIAVYENGSFCDYLKYYRGGNFNLMRTGKSYYVFTRKNNYLKAYQDSLLYYEFRTYPWEFSVMSVEDSHLVPVETNETMIYKDFAHYEFLFFSNEEYEHAMSIKKKIIDMYCS